MQEQKYQAKYAPWHTRQWKQINKLKKLQDIDICFGVEAMSVTSCEYCLEQVEPKTDDADDEDPFDENGYPVPRKDKTSIATIQQPSACAQSWNGGSQQHKPFRFLDLPSEIRNSIYELMLRADHQPVCVPDHALSPTYTDFVGFGSHFSQTLGSAKLDLERTNRQIYTESKLIPYAINTFSLHNLAYLGSFLHNIGRTARHNLKSIHFQWKMPEADGRALQVNKGRGNAYKYLLGCSFLTRISVDLDPLSLVTWTHRGTRHPEALKDLDHAPGMNIAFKLRDLKDIKVRWKDPKPFEGNVEAWVRRLIGLWRLPKGVSKGKCESFDGDVTLDGDWSCAHWQANEEQESGD